MTPSQLMQALSDAGAPFEAILIAVQALDAKDAEIAARDTAAAEKRAKDAERKRLARTSGKRPRKVRGRSKECPPDPPIEELHTPRSEDSSNDELQNDACAIRDDDWIEIPDWVPVKPWNAFLEMRREIRKWPTADAVELMVGKLDRWRLKGHDPTEILNTSTECNWTGLFEPKGRKNGHADRPTTRDLGMQLAERRQRSGSDCVVDLLPGPRAAGGHV